MISSTAKGAIRFDDSMGLQQDMLDITRGPPKPRAPPEEIKPEQEIVQQILF